MYLEEDPVCDLSPSPQHTIRVPVRRSISIPVQILGLTRLKFRFYKNEMVPWMVDSSDRQKRSMKVSKTRIHLHRSYTHVPLHLDTKNTQRNSVS